MLGPAALLLWMAAAYEVRVDPRIETAAVMARLAGYEEFQDAGLEGYDAAVAAHFAKYRNHPSIAVMRRLRKEHNIAFNAVPGVAVLADSPVTWRARSSPEKAGVDRRWNAKRVDEFMKAAREFTKASGAAAFFESQAAVHRGAERALREALADRFDTGWLARFYGARAASARMLIVPGLLHGPANYGLNVVLPGKDGEEIYAVIATPPGRESRYPADTMLSLLVHEISHSFVNPWVDEHAKPLEEAANVLFREHAARLRAEAYGAVRTMLYETVVRGCTIRYFLDHGEKEAAARAERDDRFGGFLWTGELANLLEGGLKEEAVRRYLAELSANPAKFRVGPQVAALSPADGDFRVDPKLTELEIRFDRAMAKGISVYGTVPEVTGKPVWSEDGRVLRIPVKLERGRRYRVLFNAGEATAGFASAEGERMLPRGWSFGVAP